MYISISATKGNKTKHVGMYGSKESADRVEKNIDCILGPGWDIIKDTYPLRAKIGTPVQNTIN